MFYYRKSKMLIMKKLFFSIFLVVFLMQLSIAQPANWVNPLGMQYSMGINAQASSVGGCFISQTGSMVAAFKDGDCRGATTVFPGPIGPQFLLSVMSNSPNETGFEIRVWDALLDSVFIANEGFDFNVSSTIGLIGAPQIYTINTPCFVNPGGLANSMTINAQVQFAGGNFFTDSLCILYAFKDGVCRGVAQIETGTAGQQFILSVVSDSIYEPTFNLKIFDGSSLILYDVNETFDFVKDTTLGTEAIPIIYTVGYAPPVISGIFTTSYNGYSVSCFGANDANINVNVIEGIPPITYLWNTGATSQDLYSVGAGTYSVTVTDNQGISVSEIVNVTQPAVLASTVVGTDLSCFQDGSGNVDLTVGGGVMPYTFSWSNGEQTEDLTNLQIGTYVVSISDANSCSTVSNTIVLTEPTVLSGIISGTDIPDCYGNTNGSIDLSISGGSPLYTFQWSNGAVSEDLMNIGAGYYEVVVSDLNNCTLVLNQTINQPDELVTTISANDVLCHGFSTGNIDLTASGGTTPYSYLWSDGQTTEDLNSIPAGNYSVTILDNNLCEETNSILVVEPDAIDLTIVSSDVTIYGYADGSININVTGGMSPYSYLWSTSETTQNIEDLSAGIYQLTITDSYSCIFEANIEITQPEPTVVHLVSANVSCYGAEDGTITLTLTGDGTPPFSYLWSNSGVIQNLVNLSSGAYSVTVTDANGLISTASDTVHEPSPILLNATSTVSASCFNFNDGSVLLEAAGGTAPYEYSIDGGAYQANGLFLLLSAGTYIASVQDGFGCTTGLDFSIDYMYEAPHSNFDYVTAGGVVQFVNYSDTSGNATWLWDFDDGNYDSTKYEPTHEYLTNGTYNVSFTINNQCGSNSLTRAIEIRAAFINENSSLDNQLMVFPNPTSGIFKINWDEIEYIKINKFRIFDVFGKMVLSVENPEIQGNEKSINMSEFEQGLYSIQIITEEGVVNKQIILLR